jgi:hypothetical protein
VALEKSFQACARHQRRMGDRWGGGEGGHVSLFIQIMNMLKTLGQDM